VRIFIRDPEAESRCKGLVEHDEISSWGEVIVADCTGFGAICDRFREHGAKVVGGSALADRLETDRAFATEVMEQCGLETPESESFTDWESAIAFIGKSKDKLVFKPEGKLSGVVPSYCPSSNEELLESIEHFKFLCGNASPEFTLQQFIEGVCVSTEGWFDGEKFIEPFNHTVERKHFLAGDLGPSGGCTGNLVWACERDDPIAQETVLRMEGFLREHSYRGAIDVNAVVNEEGVYALEFTPRFGYDAFPTLLYALYEGSMGELLWDIASGAGRARMDVSNNFGAGIRLSVPPWPSEQFKAERGIPIRGIAQARLATDLYPYDVELEEDRLVTSGAYGIVGVMNASGETIEESFSEAYRKARRVKCPDLQYRTDLQEVCEKDYRKLERIVSNVHA
jgi:phosphoribosylamine---glycine ligase